MLTFYALFIFVQSMCNDCNGIPVANCPQLLTTFDRKALLALSLRDSMKRESKELGKNLSSFRSL